MVIYRLNSTIKTMRMHHGFQSKTFKERLKIMEQLTFMMAPIAVVLVFIVLCIGLWNMMRGTNPNLSQKLMRWRVGLQFAAVCLLMTVILFDS